MWKKTLIWLIVSILSLSLFAGCSVGKTAQAPSESEKLKVVTTIFPCYDLARAVAGERADLSMLVRPGAEIHSFDPSPQDILAVKNADVFIYIGGESDVWVDDLLASMDLSDKTIVRLMDAVTPVEEEIVEGMQADEDGHGDENDAHEEETPEEADHEEHEFDEHIWTSPKNAIALTQAIADALAKADADNAKHYEENATAYCKEIEAIDAEFSTIVSEATRKHIVVADKFPFRYLVDAYGLSYSAAFPGCSTESDCSAATMAHLVNSVEGENLPVIYTVEMSSQNIAKAIAEQTGAEILTLHSCHNVSPEDFSGGATYVSIMRKNAESLRKGLN